MIWNYPDKTAAVVIRAYCEIPGYMAVRIGNRGRDYCSASLLLWLSEARPAGLRGRQLGVIYTRSIAKSPFYIPWPSTNSLSGLFPFQNTPTTVTTHRPYSTECFIIQLDGFQLLKLYQIVEIQKTLKVWPKQTNVGIFVIGASPIIFKQVCHSEVLKVLGKSRELVWVDSWPSTK